MFHKTPPDKKSQRTYWRREMESAKRAMDLYPAGSDEREIYRAKYTEAVKRYNDLFEDVNPRQRTKEGVKDVN